MSEKNTGFILWVLVFCSFRCCSTNNEGDRSRQTFVIRYKDGEQTIPVTVVLDYKKQTEYVINMNPRTPAKSVTLYDFKQKTIAYKDLTNRECFLGRLTHETLSEQVNALQDVKSPVEGQPKLRSLDPRRPALTPTEIRNLAGQKTAVFCRKMNTWLLMPDTSHGISKREAAEDEFEERTLHYHGHRSTQYSHFERETRRRYRNGRRAHAFKSVADKENRFLEVPELHSASSFPNHDTTRKFEGNKENGISLANRRSQNGSKYPSSRGNLLHSRSSNYWNGTILERPRARYHDWNNRSEVVPTTTGTTDRQELNYPNVHPSLVHLLPLYKPLGQEFDSRTNSMDNRTRLQKNIESELEPDYHVANGYNTSQDPDVSVNVLGMTKPFENTAVSLSYDPAVSVPNSVPRIYYRNLDGNPSSAIDAHLETPVDKKPYSRESSRPIAPVLTTPEYFVTDRTTSSVYVPSVHTAFQNSEDFLSFQIFPSYVQNNNTPSFERNLTALALRTSDIKHESTTRHLFSTTQYPPTESKRRTSHGSDIPSEDSSSLPHPSFVSRTNQNEIVPPRRIRYQSALRDFKPDEIVIDVENVATHTFAPTTTRLPLRPGAKRGEQTSWHAFYPATRYPKRRFNDKIRRPTQQSPPVVYPQRVSQVDQLVGGNHYPPVQLNQIHHLGHLPPGVSMHPRHPQAPFADMVHSNRPPTIPLSKPHRQRHHRKKDSTCCRLRGKSCCSERRSSCCSSSKVNQIQPGTPPIRNTKRSGCQKEQMCRTVYESTRQVIVCRNSRC